jgi:uncharacterized damage-inducible protein DinB
MQIENQFLNIISTRFSKAIERIVHAVTQLDDQQIWHRPSSSSNSVGIILQHLSGNLNQWIYSAIGGHAFDRNRPQEFDDMNTVPKKELLQQISVLDEKIQDTVLQITPESLLARRRIQGFDETVMSALIAALTHLELHTGQISFLTKLMLDKDYKVYWKPLNKEQGKE